MVTKDLLDNGAACIFDLLHTYTSKMINKLKLPLSIPPGANVDVNHVQAVMEAWTEECSELVKNVKEKCTLKYCSAMFTDLEIQLIKKLLDLIYIFSQCSCDVKLETIEEDTLKKLASIKGESDRDKGDIPPKRPCASAKGKKSSSVKNKSDSLFSTQEENQPLSDAAKQYQVCINT